MAAIDLYDLTTKQRELTTLDLENSNSEGGEPIPGEWSLDKQANGDIKTGLMGCLMVAEIVSNMGGGKVVGIREGKSS